MADNLTPEQRRRNMTGIRSRNTKPEILVRSLIHRLGYRFRLHPRKLPGKPDVVLPRHKKLVLVHGCFWHMHNCKRGNVKPQTNEEYWHMKRQKTTERDVANQLAYDVQGWTTLVVWECETTDYKKLTEILSSFLQP